MAARLIVFAVIAALAAWAIVPLAHMLRPLLEGGALLALAAAAVWLIAAAPFRGP